MIHETEQTKLEHLSWLKLLVRRFLRKQNNSLEVVNAITICTRLMKTEDLLTWCKKNLWDEGYRIVCTVLGTDDYSQAFLEVWSNDVSMRFSNASYLNYCTLHPGIKANRAAR